MNIKRSKLIGAAVAVALLGTAAVTLGTSTTKEIEAAAPTPVLSVVTDTPRAASLTLTLAANGNVSAWQEASIGSEANGLRLDAIRVDVGDVVQRGQVLATFDADTVKAELHEMQAKLDEADAQAGDAAANAARARSLVSSGALSEQEISQFVTAEATARARAAAQRASVERQKLRLAKAQVLAPDDGVISARTATVGAVVPAGQELFRLVRQGRLEWRAEVTAAELSRIELGATASIRAPDGTSVKGKVRTVAPTVDEKTRLGLVYVDLPTQLKLRPGMFAKGEFDLGRSSALTVPQQALVVRDGFSYVFQLRSDGRVEQVRVTTARRTADRVEVLDLPAQTTLIASGAGFLNDGDIVKVIDALGQAELNAAAEPQRTESVVL